MNGLLASRLLVCRTGLLNTVARRPVSLLWAKNQPLNQKLVPAVYSCNQKLMSSESHSHTKLWTVERVVSGALLLVIPGAIVINNPILDYALALSLVLHIHWGLEAIVVDYIRPKLFGPVIPKVSLGALYLLSILTLGGLFYMNYSDVGVSHGLRMLMKL